VLRKVSHTANLTMHGVFVPGIGGDVIRGSAYSEGNNQVTGSSRLEVKGSGDHADNDPSIVDRLGVIALAKVAGFELREIRETLSTVGDSQPAPTWKRLGETKRVALDQQIARLTRMKDALAKLDGCRCVTLEGCGRAFNSARSSGMNGQTQ
jgi:hypothetical protein